MSEEVNQLLESFGSSGDDLQDLQETVVKGVAATAAAVVVGYAAFKRARSAAAGAKRDLDGAVSEFHRGARRVMDAPAEELWRLAVENFVSPKIREACGFVQEMNEKLDSNRDPYMTPFMVLLALVKKGQDGRNKVWMDEITKGDDSENEPCLPPDHHRDAGLLACRIYAASLTGDPADRAEAMGLAAVEDGGRGRRRIFYENFDDGVMRVFGDQDFCPKYAIVLPSPVDAEVSTVTLVVRGTYSPSDVCIDLLGEEEPFLRGFAHRGMVRATRTMLSKAVPHVKRAFEEMEEGEEEKKPRKLLICGHSMGGGVVTLATMILREEGNDLGLDGVECISLAPPPVFRPREEEASSSDYEDVIHTYILGQDCVPSLCLSSVSRLVSTLRAVDDLPFTAAEQFQLLDPCGPHAPWQPAWQPEKTVKNLETLERTVAEAEAAFPRLEHPGRLNFLHEVDPASLFSSLFPPSSTSSSSTSSSSFVVSRCRLRSSHFDSELRLLERMLADHLHHTYARVLETF